MTAQPIVQVDAFASAPFTGNPAAVCVLDAAADEAWMQAVAVEMNLSETAYLYRTGETWALRWFTPGGEVALCGHATLASAHVLWTEGHVDGDAALRFDTASGELVAQREGDGTITLDFPATPPTFDEGAPAGLLEALGLDGRDDVTVGRSRFDAFVVVEELDALLALEPDMTGLAAVDARGTIVTAPGGEGVALTSRFFAPGLGVPEDPVTGSAHCALAPYWAARLGRDRLEAHQASARGGWLRVEVRGERVLLTGRALTVLRGTLLT